MINSIQQFQEKGGKNLTEIFSHYTDDLTRFAEMVYGVTKEVTILTHLLSSTYTVIFSVIYSTA